MISTHEVCGLGSVPSREHDASRLAGGEDKANHAPISSAPRPSISLRKLLESELDGRHVSPLRAPEEPKPLQRVGKQVSRRAPSERGWGRGLLATLHVHRERPCREHRYRPAGRWPLRRPGWGQRSESPTPTTTLLSATARRLNLSRSCGRRPARSAGGRCPARRRRPPAARCGPSSRRRAGRRGRPAPAARRGRARRRR